MIVPHRGHSYHSGWSDFQDGPEQELRPYEWFGNWQVYRIGSMHGSGVRIIHTRYPKHGYLIPYERACLLEAQGNQTQLLLHLTGEWIQKDFLYLIELDIGTTSCILEPSNVSLSMVSGVLLSLRGGHTVLKPNEWNVFQVSVMPQKKHYMALLVELQGCDSLVLLFGNYRVYLIGPN